MVYNANKFHQLLAYAVKNEISDIHLREGEMPYLRIKGRLKKIKAEVITPNDMKLFCHIMFQDDSLIKKFSTLKEHDCSYQYKNLCRVRVNFFKIPKKKRFNFKNHLNGYTYFNIIKPTRCYYKNDRC